LPEWSTVIESIRLNRYDMAIGDVFGTNIMNVMIIVLIDALNPGDPVLQAAGRFAGFAAVLALLLTSVFMIGLLERRDRTVLRMGLDSLVVVLVYAAGVVVLHGLR
jgi:cation:H+ antiporter